jgi:hypothetical protein
MTKENNKKQKYKQKYKIGDSYLIELGTNNMLYYKKYDSILGDYQLIKAKDVQTSFDSKELYELAMDLGEKMQLTVS